MGAKTHIEQASTMTPQQLALLNSQLRNVRQFTEGMVLGQGWGGPTFESYQPNVGYGGKRWGTARPQAAGAMPPAAQALGAAPAGPATQPSVMNTMSPAGYQQTNQIVTPFVNPFRRNLGG